MSSFIGICERTVEMIEWCMALALALLGALEVPLNAGDYTVSVTNPTGNATSPITVVKSTDPALITLTLARPAK